jgi:hypothetical protein
MSKLGRAPNVYEPSTVGRIFNKIEKSISDIEKKVIEIESTLRSVQSLQQKQEEKLR